MHFLLKSTYQEVFKTIFKTVFNYVGDVLNKHVLFIRNKYELKKKLLTVFLFQCMYTLELY